MFRFLNYRVAAVKCRLLSDNISFSRKLRNGTPIALEIYARLLQK